MPEYLAIGDIHGMYSALDALLREFPQEGELVFLGDYIDRGPDSKMVIDYLIGLAEGRRCHFLRGNHEEMMLSALEADSANKIPWLAYGGLQTLDSYPGSIPTRHREFIQRTSPMIETDEYIFVHAGLQPGISPGETDSDVYLWVREPFLSSNYDWGRKVIHGHTPLSNGKPDIRANRINIDTGAVYGGALTAIILPECEFISIPTS